MFVIEQSYLRNNNASTQRSQLSMVNHWKGQSSLHNLQGQFRSIQNIRYYGKLGVTAWFSWASLSLRQDSNAKNAHPTPKYEKNLSGILYIGALSLALRPDTSCCRKLIRGHCGYSSHHPHTHSMGLQTDLSEVGKQGNQQVIYEFKSTKHTCLQTSNGW